VDGPRHRGLQRSPQPNRRTLRRRLTHISHSRRSRRAPTPRRHPGPPARTHPPVRAGGPPSAHPFGASHAEHESLRTPEPPG
jgi:hypothetical protein